MLLKVHELAWPNQKPQGKGYDAVELYTPVNGKSGLELVGMVREVLM